MRRVTVGKVYQFVPAGWDVMMPQHYSAHRGQMVRVVNLPGAPRANTMGQCHIADSSTGEFLGMVSIHSLNSTRED
jgi:hypothetical protein